MDVNKTFHFMATEPQKQEEKKKKKKHTNFGGFKSSFIITEIL